MTDAPVTRLDGYDRDGLHVGGAVFLWWTGAWKVVTRNGDTAATDEADARRLLAEAGAVEVKESDGGGE